MTNKDIAVSYEGSDQVNWANVSPFTNNAEQFNALGLAILPIKAGNKTPHIQSFQKFPKSLSSSTIGQWISKWPSANIGLRAAKQGITVVDIDDAALVTEAIEHFGPTPLQAKTPSGGYHLFYRANGERQVIRWNSQPIDIKAGPGAYVLIEPSVTAKGQYRFISGSHADLADASTLPTIRPGALVTNRGSSAVIDTQKGQRNKALFQYLGPQARACDDWEALLDCAETWNSQQSEPLPSSEVAKTAQSVWKYEREGCNVIGMKSPGRMVSLSEDGIRDLGFRNPNARTLLDYIALVHSLDAEFPFSSAAVAEKSNLGWGKKRIDDALWWLVREGWLVHTFKGRPGKRANGNGNPHRFKFGPKFNWVKVSHNITNTPAPPVIEGEYSHAEQRLEPAKPRKPRSSKPRLRKLPEQPSLFADNNSRAITPAAACQCVRPGIQPENVCDCLAELWRPHGRYGYSQQEVADSIEISRPQLANVVQGRFGLSERSAALLGAFLADIAA